MVFLTDSRATQQEVDSSPTYKTFFSSIQKQHKGTHCFLRNHRCFRKSNKQKHTNRLPIVSVTIGVFVQKNSSQKLIEVG